MPAASLTLAQSSLDPKAFVYFGILIVLAIAGGMLIFAAKRRLFKDDDNQTHSSAGLMATLDQMRRDGKISQEEYDQTRRTIVGKTIEQLDARRQADDHPGPDAQ